MHWLGTLWLPASIPTVESQFHLQYVGTDTRMLGKTSEILHIAHHEKLELAVAFELNLWSVPPSCPSNTTSQPKIMAWNDRAVCWATAHMCWCHVWHKNELHSPFKLTAMLWAAFKSVKACWTEAKLLGLKWSFPAELLGEPCGSGKAFVMKEEALAACRVMSNMKNCLCCVLFLQGSLPWPLYL